MVDNDYDYIHPAFCDGSSNNYMNREWDNEISGFWIAKFPAGWQQNKITDNDENLSSEISNNADTLIFSDSNYTYTDSFNTVAIGEIGIDTKMSLPVFIPLTYAYNCISIGDSYTLSQQVTRASNSSSFYGLNSSNADSHMLKNSEWGAVAYLTQSQYGTNGTEPNINNYYTNASSPYYRTALTGVYANLSSTEPTTSLSDVSAWYTNIGKEGSSTGNITGVYDLNGCVWERVAGYISDGSSYLSDYSGSSEWIIIEDDSEGYRNLSSKYFTVYPYNSSDDMPESNWIFYDSLKNEKYGYGDAILETSTLGTGANAWFTDYSYFPDYSHPFFNRGGTYSYGSRSGVFAFNTTDGSQYHSYGFRVALVCE